MATPPGPRAGAVGGARLTESATRLVCGALGVLALVLVVLVAGATSDTVDGGGAALGAPGSQAPAGQPGGTAPTSSAATSPGSSTSPPAGRASGPGFRLTPAFVEAHFPFPPGAATAAGTPPVAGVQVRQVRAPLAIVKRFYDISLRRFDGQWTDPLTTTSGSGAIAGWHGSVFFPTIRGFEPQLSLDENYSGDQPGVVRIEVDFR